MTGLELKLRRTAARIRGREIAGVMGVTASRVSAIEREAFPTPETQRRYLAALDTLTNVRNIPTAEVAS